MALQTTNLNFNFCKMDVLTNIVECPYCSSDDFDVVLNYYDEEENIDCTVYMCNNCCSQFAKEFD